MMLSVMAVLAGRVATLLTLVCANTASFLATAFFPVATTALACYLPARRPRG